MIFFSKEDLNSDILEKHLIVSTQAITGFEPLIVNKWVNGTCRFVLIAEGFVCLMVHAATEDKISRAAIKYLSTCEVELL